MSNADTDDVDAVLAAVRERVTPDAAERDQLRSVVRELTGRAEAAIEDLPVDAEVLQVGSTARNTWLAGDRDVDLFVAFPPALSRAELEEYGLQVGHTVLPDGHEEYAEHPYVVGESAGVQVDLVPCYDVAAATDIRSAVDRTPFHTRYLDGALDGLAGDVRVCKQLCVAAGVYGSDLRTRGFSGFLIELLVLAHGGARRLVEAAADWHPPVTVDLEDHATVGFDGPLVVVDPTDPERNVAAVTAPESLARFQHHTRALLADPTVDRFEPDEPAPLDPADVRAHLDRRDTTALAVRFPAPAIVDDQLWPQLEKSRAGLAAELDRRGFAVLRSTALAEDRLAGGERGVAALLFELAVAERPAVERHEGPPVHVREHASDFYEAYAHEDTDGTAGATDDGPGVYGPYVDNDRYVVERPREFTTAAGFCESEAVLGAALGARIEPAFEGRTVLVGDEVATLADPFGRDLAAYFAPTP